MYKKSLLNHTKLYLGPFNLNWAILTYVELDQFLSPAQVKRSATHRLNLCRNTVQVIYDLSKPVIRTAHGFFFSKKAQKVREGPLI